MRLRAAIFSMKMKSRLKNLKILTENKVTKMNMTLTGYKCKNPLMKSKKEIS
jgi:hypothetical protein